MKEIFILLEQDGFEGIGHPMYPYPYVLTSEEEARKWVGDSKVKRAYKRVRVVDLASEVKFQF